MLINTTMMLRKALQIRGLRDSLEGDSLPEAVVVGEDTWQLSFYRLHGVTPVAEFDHGGTGNTVVRITLYE